MSKEKDELEEIQKPLKNAGWFILLGFVFTLGTPWLLTIPSLFPSLNFSSTGSIGDTIGGITSPVIGLLGAILLFLALKAQVKANSLIQRQLNHQSETNQLYQFYNHLKENIDNFTFERTKHVSVNTFPKTNENPHGLGEIEDKEQLKGTIAIYEFFGDLICHQTDRSDELTTDPKLSELTSTLTILNFCLKKLKPQSLRKKKQSKF